MSPFTAAISRAATLLLLMAFLATACGSHPSARPPVRRPPASPVHATEAARALAQYQAFWPALARASGTSPPARRQILATYLAEPELSRSPQAMAAQDALGRQVYGVDRPRAAVRSLAGPQAQIVDCQDSTGSGVLERGSGERLSVGVAHNPLLARLRRAEDNRWRIYRITYTGGIC